MILGLFLKDSPTLSLYIAFVTPDPAWYIPDKQLHNLDIDFTNFPCIDLQQTMDGLIYINLAQQ